MTMLHRESTPAPQSDAARLRSPISAPRAHASPHPTKAFASALALVLGFFAPSVPAQSLQPVWTEDVAFTLAPPPAAADLDADGSLELVLADGESDRLAALDPRSGKPLWIVEVPVAGSFTFPPVAGQFTGDGSVEIVAVSSEGTLILIEGLTGNPISTRELEAPPASMLTLVPLAASASEPGSFREGVAMVDAGGLLQVFEFSAGSTPETAFQFRQSGVSDNPALLASLGEGFPDPALVFLTGAGRLSIAPLRAAQESDIASFPISQARTLKTFLAAGDVSGDGRDDLVVADDRGWLSIFTGREGRLFPLWPPVSIGREPTSVPLLVDVDDDRKLDILIHQDAELRLINGATGQADLWTASGGAYVHDLPISAPPAIIARDAEAPLAAFGDPSGRVALLDLRAGALLRGEDGQPVVHQAGGDHAARTTLLAGPLRGRPRTDLFLLGSRSGSALILDAGLAWPADLPAWSGAMGGAWRTGALSARFSRHLEASRVATDFRFQAEIAAARAAVAEKRWEDAQTSVRAALALQPHDAAALELRESISDRLNRGARGLAFALLLAAVAAGAALSGRPGLRLLRRFLSRRALEAGRKPEAVSHLRAVYASQPSSTRSLKDLADLLLDLKDYGPATPPIYEAACAAFPNDDRYPKALAYAYSAQGRRDQRAADAYAAMTRVVSHPGPWAFTLGQTLESLGNDREAMDAYHLALRHGFENPELNEALASLYVKLELREPEILPILRRALPRRMNDAAFLRVYCLCAARARAFDEDAERAATRLLELQPDAAPARLVLATRLLQSGNRKAALSHAEALAAAGADGAQGQLLLAECYAADDRRTDEARAIYERALHTYPDARNVQAALARIYASDGRADAPALDLYRAAVAAEPAPDFLRQVAALASAAGDRPLLIDAGERLRADGQQIPPNLLLELAHACIDQGRTGDAVRSILRDALDAQAKDQPVAEALARYYIDDDRTDTEAIAVYEAACAVEPKPIEVVHQLIKAYSDSQVSERALVLAREFLEKHPDDTTLVKLAAGASAALDRLDDAIRGYEGIYQKDPDDNQALTELARLYRRKELTDEKAMAVYRRAIEVAPENLDLHEALAAAQAAQGDWDGVVRTVKHFLTFAPRQIDAAIGLMTSLAAAPGASAGLRWFLVETLILRSQFSEAIEQIRGLVEKSSAHTEQALAAYEKIIDRQPDQPDAHHHRGNLLVRIGRASEARQALERALRLRPKDEALKKDLLACYEKLVESRDSIDLRFKTGRLAMELARYDLAISCFQKTDKDERFSLESVRSLAKCFLAKGMLDLALHELKKLDVADDTKGLLYELGRAYEASGDPRGAREAYKSIYAVDINYQDVKARMDTLLHAVTDPNSPERTAIISSLSEEAKTRYDLIQELGRGAMGIVYKARDNELEEIVALKILPESLEKNLNALRMFREEARNARRLAHNGIVRIHDIGEERGRKYISMEFVDGIDLKQRLIETKRNLPFAETLHYARQIADAMAAAHEARIVHRDLKPANIMITKQKRVKVTDFGIAKMIQDETTSAHTKSKTVVGTPLYMSPEQVKGEPVDERADIYSMGIMFYEMASGRPPFIEGDLAYHHVTTPPQPLPDKVPAEFARIVMKCLEKKPQDRWQTAAEVLAALTQIESGEPEEAMP